MAGVDWGAGLLKLRWLRSLSLTTESIKSLSGFALLLLDLLLERKERLLCV